MPRAKNFSFKWKLVENYVAAGVGALFLWFMIRGIANNDGASLVAAIIILVIAPFLVTFVDRKSSGK